MQRLLFSCFLVVVFATCQKQIQAPVKIDYPELKQSLQQQLSAPTYQLLDFSRIARTTYDDITLLRVPFTGKSVQEQFVLVEVTPTGKIKRGRVVELTPDKTVTSYNGKLLIKTLAGDIIEEARLIKGYREKKKVLMKNVLSQPDPYIELPEVIIVATYPSSGGGVSWGTYMNLMSYISNSGGGGTGWYSGGGGGGGSSTGASPSTGGSGGAGGGTIPANTSGPQGPTTVVDDEVIKVDFESQYDDPAIDVEKYLKCFDKIPDAGATCKITIFADVPVNSDPTKIMDWSTGSPGHSWIRIEKTGAGTSGTVSQHLGFYPKTGWKTTFTDAPLPGKFVDNSAHEFNASYEVSVSAVNLRTALMKIRQLARTQYDIDDYNCTDWAIQVWRAAVSPSIWFDIPRFQMPGSLAPKGTSTPQGLYVKIRQLQKAGISGTTVPVVGWSGKSSGPCN